MSLRIFITIILVFSIIGLESAFSQNSGRSFRRSGVLEWKPG